MPDSPLADPLPANRRAALHLSGLDHGVLALLRAAGASDDLQTIAHTPPLDEETCRRLMALGGFGHELLAANPTTPAALLDAIARQRWSCPPALGKHLAANPNLGHATLFRLIPHHPEQAIANPVFELGLLAGHFRVDMLPAAAQRALAGCPRSPEWLLTHLAQLRTSTVLGLVPVLLANPSLGAEAVRHLWAHTHDHTQGAPGRIRLLLAHPQTPIEEIEKRSRSGSRTIRALAAASPRLPPGALIPLTLDPHDAVREAALANPTLPPRWRDLLARAGAYAPGIPPGPLSEREQHELLSAGLTRDALRVRFPSPEHFAVRLLLRNPHLPWPALEKLAGRVYSKLQATELLATNTSAPPSFLARMLSHAQWSVRKLALGNPSAPRSVVALLLRAGADAELRDTAPGAPLATVDVARLLRLGPFASLLLARHPCASPRLLRRIQERHGDDPVVTRALARHPAAPLDMLAGLVVHRSERVRKSAARSSPGTD